MKTFAEDGDFTLEYAKTYSETRAHYPPALIDLLITEINFDSDWLVADIGSGPGLLSDRFLENGNQVWAVEKSARMRLVASKRLQECARIQIVNGTAESTKLSNNQIDLIAVGHAFHQFNVDNCRQEFFRILKPTGWIMLVWNYLKAGGLEATRAFADLLRRYEGGGGGDMSQPTRSSANDLFKGDFKEFTLDSTLQLELESAKRFILMHRSVPFEGAVEKLHTDLVAIFKKFGEHKRVLLDYSTFVYLGKAVSIAG